MHAELYRQQKLVRWNDVHLKLYERIKAWGTAKQQYLEAKVEINSSGDAEFALKTVNNFVEELKGVTTGTVAELEKLGNDLIAEKYENSAVIQVCDPPPHFTLFRSPLSRH